MGGVAVRIVPVVGGGSESKEAGIGGSIFPEYGDAGV